MNNASLLLNVARPSALATSGAPVTGAAASGTPSSSQGFDHAMDAAHADARKDDAAKKDDASGNAANASANAPAGKATGDKAGANDAKDAKKNDDTAKKDDKATDDTSIAASVLALIGVPTQVTQVAAKALGVAKDVATGHAGDALATLTGIGKGGDAADGVAAAKDGGLNALGLAAQGATDASAASPGVNPFAALMAAEGAGSSTGGDKDDGKGTDLSLTGPMPFAHAQGATPLDGPMQLQATQPATAPQFTQELGEQIAWMSSAAGSVKEARIKLHPEELGSMDVRVNVDGGKVNVAIIAQHPAAVHAVQQTLSNLDSMLAHHGLSLGQAEVNQGGAQQGGNGGSPGQGTGQGGSADTQGETLSVASTSRVSRGLVDETA